VVGSQAELFPQLSLIVVLEGVGTLAIHPGAVKVQWCGSSSHLLWPSEDMVFVRKVMFPRWESHLSPRDVLTGDTAVPMP